MIDLVIFDCDGVLVDSEPIANRMLADHATRFGVPISTEDSIRLFVGRSMKSVVEMLGQMAGRPPPPDFPARLQEDTFQKFRGELKAVPGVAAAIRRIAASGRLTCVASSGGYDKMDVTLGLTGLRSYFEGRIFSAVDVARGKPAPDLFLHAAQRMGISPSRCAVIEDSLPGIDAGIAAGMKVYGYVPDGDASAHAGRGAQVFWSMDDLPGLIDAGLTGKG